jgi:hypothetical protein
MTPREDSSEPRRQPTEIVSRLERLAAEYCALPVYDPRSADEIVGYDANGLPG